MRAAGKRRCGVGTGGVVLVGVVVLLGAVALPITLHESLDETRHTTVSCAWRTCDDVTIEYNFIVGKNEINSTKAWHFPSELTT